MATASSALRKLQSGQSLTDEEKELLNLPTSKSTATPVVVPQVNADDKPDSYYTKVLASGKTQAQIDALRNAYDTAAQIRETITPISPVTSSTVDRTTGQVVTTYKDPNMIQMLNGILYKGGIPINGQEGNIKYVNGRPSEMLDPKTGKWVPYTENVSSVLTNNNGSSKELNDLKAQIAALQNQNTAAANIAAANAAKEAEAKRQSIIAVLTDRFNKYGLGSLVTKIRDLAVDGATEATITLALQETPEYQQRFAANTERLKKNLQVLTPAEYLNLEDGYRQVLRAYGLKQFDTDEYVRQFISNDVSAAELSDRVVTAVQRVQNADPAVARQLRDYYGIGNADLVAYVLDPNQQLPKIQRQVAAAEIGAAAAVQGITAGVSVAEQLAAQGVTKAEAQKGYATIADILPTAEKLSAIYGGVEAGYGLGEAEQEVFNSLAEAQRKRERLTSREIASFSGRSGIARTGLTQTTQGQF